MSNKNVVKATLDVTFRSGKYGLFPVGTLHTQFGSFACRDKWLETLDTGSYEGEFEISEIALSGYMTAGEVREQRTFIKVTINSYYLDSVNDNISHSDYHSLDDPIFDEDKPESGVSDVNPSISNDQPQISELSTPDKTSSENNLDEDNMIDFIQEQLRSVGNNTEWKKGDALTIPADLGRAEQRKIRDYLTTNGYKMTDPFNRLWEHKESANV
ncbi:DUF3275 family protein [Pasteurella atlantica]|uniref:DUF3275 family protein n=2 Tax=Pasteurellaceae TaxID=712 RepID=A0ACC6HL28_9PAST|nr:DUF3275 family protein [Pasteurella atlantica]MDP8051523.1 DUF3275 family protein [Pasteurella atlantica]MDP8104898.1 DUF3275 family protein [Pasteurella atlantica]MDP8148272.1 DUF3275 family protein [Pasteurella atlantica]